jgi:hypothetical protein
MALIQWPVLALDSVCRLIIVPWGPVFIARATGLSWRDSVLWFALLVVAYNAGKSIVGFAVSTSPRPAKEIQATVNRIAFLLLVLHLLMPISTRMGLWFVMRLLVGALAALMLKLFTQRAGHVGVLGQRQQQDGTQSMSTKLYVCCVVGMFTPLLSAFLYDDSTGSEYPLLYPFWLLAFVFAVMTALTLAPRGGTSRRKVPVSSVASKEIPLRAAVDEEQPLLAVNPEDVPRTFVEDCRGDAVKATKRYQQTLQWRAATGMDHILQRPHTDFLDILDAYPHAIHGRSVNGEVVCWELIGKVQPSRIDALQITPERLLNHFQVRNEYIFQKLHGGDQDGRLMTVLDVAGIRMADLRGSVIQFIKLSSEVMDTHYPGRVARLVIIKAPGWFSSIWGMIARVLPESTIKKSSIHGTNYIDALREIIAAENIPSDYGGTSSHVLGQAPEHLELLRLVKENNAAASASAFSDAPAVAAAQTPLLTPSPASSAESTGAASAKTKSPIFSWKLPWASRPQPAFLGQDNRYRWDPVSESWVEENDGSMSSGGAGRDAADKAAAGSKAPPDDMSLEEHALVLAIQAAHLQRHPQSAGRLTASPASPLSAAREESSDRFFSEREPLRGAGHVSEEHYARHRKASAGLFLVATFSHVLACIVWSGLEFVLPVWAVTGNVTGTLLEAFVYWWWFSSSDFHVLVSWCSSAGGPHLKAMEIGVVVSAAYAVALLGMAAAGRRLIVLSSMHPVRCLRLAAGLCLISATALPLSVRLVGKTSTNLFDDSPNVSSLSLVLPVVLLSAILTAGWLLEQSSAALLRTATSNTFSSVHVIAELSSFAGRVTVMGRNVMRWLRVRRDANKLSFVRSFTGPAYLLLAVFVVVRPWTPVSDGQLVRAESDGIHRGAALRDDVVDPGQLPRRFWDAGGDARVEGQGQSAVRRLEGCV